MTNALDTINDILNRHLRPWKSNHSPHKFQQLLSGLTKETYQFQPHYDVDFPKPVNEKRRYYHTFPVRPGSSLSSGLLSKGRPRDFQKRPNDRFTKSLQQRL
jgi:hypothetical protein